MIFPSGFIVKSFKFPNGGEVIKLSIKLEEFIPFAEANSKNGWLNLEIKESKKGSKYAALDEYQKKEREPTEKQKNFQEEQDRIEKMPEPDDLPF